ncbi:MAG: hypothetical protein ABFD79_01405 [Phycisphaerales bacterium]
MEKKRIPLSVPMHDYIRLKHEADLAEQSMNRYILKLLKKRKVEIYPKARLIYLELYRIRTELERLREVKNVDIRKLVERVDRLCRSCDTFLAGLTKSIS